ncbi:hypothetical protein COLO4_10704 [Corchorus olitorius]|uniref:Uncharacterized protein n=1 Tax=Corchorus olitorius TaxID=93759 RepID=A0A1R3K7C4_9ROSI|nr:hypothetical protein COLO4_10704 [Corchorus olitorius]
MAWPLAFARVDYEHSIALINRSGGVRRSSLELQS